MKHRYSILSIVLLLLLSVSTAFASVSYLGPAGTYTEEATLLFFGDKEQIVPVTTVAEAVKMVKEGQSNYAVVPVENTIGGPVYNYLDAVVNDKDFVVIGEINLPIRQTLIVVPETKLTDIKTVMSHPQGLAQSKDWLKANLPEAKLVEVPSTAEAAKRVAQAGDKSIAAIAASRTAKVYNLDILANDLQYTDTNVTRFWVVTTKKQQTFGQQKFTIVAQGSAQALPKLLSDLDRKGFKLISLHDRPAKTTLGEYVYVIEMSGSNAPILQDVVAKHTRDLNTRVVGIFDAK